MGLRVRKIKTMIEEYSDLCMSNLNQKLGTNFQLEVNWDVIPGNVDGWNWEDEDLKSCFLVNFYAPMETAFTKLLEDPMYKEAINEQVKKIVLEPGPEGFMEWSYEGGSLICKHTMSVNFADIKMSARYIDDCANVISAAVDGGLS